MKNAIHAQLRKEHEGLDEAEIRRRLRHWLETSDSSRKALAPVVRL